MTVESDAVEVMERAAAVVTAVLNRDPAAAMAMFGDDPSPKITAVAIAKLADQFFRELCETDGHDPAEQWAAYLLHCRHTWDDLRARGEAGW